MEDFEEFVEGYNETVEAFGADRADEIYNDILSTVIGEDVSVNDVLLSEGTPLGNGMPTSAYNAWKSVGNGAGGFFSGILGKLKSLWGTVSGSKLFGLLKKGPMFILNHPFAVLGVAGGVFLIRKLYRMMVNSGNIDQYPQLQKAEQKIEGQQNEDFAGDENGVADLLYEAKRNRLGRNDVKEELEVSERYIDSTKRYKDLLDY